MARRASEDRKEVRRTLASLKAPKPPHILQAASQWELEKRYKSFGYWVLSQTHPGRIESTYQEHLPEINGGVILDFGCCRGFTTEELSEKYPNSIVHGIDIREVDIIYAQKLRTISGEFFWDDGFNSRVFGPRTLDAVIATNNLIRCLWELLNNPRVQKKFVHVLEMVKSQGYFILGGTHNTSRFYECVNHPTEFMIFQREKARFRYLKGNYCKEKDIMNCAKEREGFIEWVEKQRVA